MQQIHRSLICRTVSYAALLLGISECNTAPSTDGPTARETQRIIGGQDATGSNQFPGTMAAIAIAWPDSTGAISFNSIQCGGTLIDPWFVLTAAHCFTQEVGLGMPDYSNYRVVLTNTTYYTPKPTDIKIAGVFRHPLFRSVPGHDIALVRLSHPVSQPLTKLPTVSPPTGLAVGSPLSIFGWGGLSTDPNQQSYPANLQQANVAYYGEGNTCKQYEDLTTDPSNSLENIGATEICIGRVAGVNQPKSTCGGDSGGPAMFNDGTNNVQVGVVSHGTPYGVCGGTMPDVFTSVADHLDFINSTIAGNRADLDGDGTKDTTVYLAEGLSNLQLYLTFDTGKIPANMTQSLGPIDTGIPVLYARDQGVDYRTAMQISPQDADASDDVLVNVGGLKAFFAGSQLYSITAKILTLNGFPSADKNDGRFGALATRGLATVDRPYATFYIVQPAPGAPFQVDVFDADNVGYWDKPLDGVKTCVRLFADPNTNGGEDDVDGNGQPLAPIVSTSFGPTPPFDTGWVQLSGGNITPTSDAFNGTSWGYRLEIYLAPVTAPAGTADSCDLGPTAQTIPDGVINGYKVATDAQLKLSDVDFGFMAVDSAGDYTPNPPDPYIQSKDTNYYGFFTFPFYVGNSTYQGTFTNADADDLDHPSPSLAIGANQAINFRIYAFKQHAHGFYPPSEFPNETAIGRPSGGYNPNQGYVEGDQETITDLPMNPFGDGSTASHDAAYGAWLWDKVMDSNIVHLWVPRGSPPHLDYMMGGSSYVPISAALSPLVWRANAGLGSRLPIVLGVPGAQVISVNTVSQAQSMLNAATKVDGSVSGVANRLQGRLLAAKLNRKLAQERGEDLGSGQIYGTNTSVASVLDSADSLVGQGASASTTAMDQVGGQLGSINAGQVTYVALPINDSGDKDPDGDGIIANLDNCPTVANSNQLDSDKNGIGDACEPTPYVRCVVKRSTDYLAYFGYTNQYADRRIAVGNNNSMSPGAINRGQPALQHLGDEPYAVTVPFTSSVTWSLAGHSATANTLSPGCAGFDVTHVNFGQNVVLYASGDLKIDDRVKLVGWTTAANAGTGTTDIGASANVGNIMSVANVTVRSSATVNGLLQSSGSISPQAGANLLGGSQPHATLSVPPLAWSVTFPPPTGGDVTLNSGAPARSLAPGSYGTVQLNGNGPLQLSAGTYYMTSLQINNGGVIQLEQSLGAITIYVQSALSYQGSFEVIGGGQPKLLLGYFGTSTAYLQAPLSAAVVAPNATVVLGGQGSGQYSGSFFAKNIEANAGTTFQFLAVGP